ncbi:MAG TPA: MOSC domain-containing protein [Gammaproteobacteria bacterium]|jgi:uncharacterized protein YcbX|nr:MOSC domain-containing protein [Gammaproteobacteria bacterium]
MLGVVRELWRYPVKSMGGEACESLRVEQRGAQGDRRFAVRDAKGKLGSGKTTRRFRRMDGLLEFRASGSEHGADIAFPDGRTLRSDDAAVHEALSAVLAEPVTLVQEAQVSHLDAAPIHIVTTAALEWIGNSLPDVRIDARRFRPNLVIETDGTGVVELGWIGRRLRVGDEVVLEVAGRTERCAMVALPQGDLEMDPRVLHALALCTDVCFGVYAHVVATGSMRLHDAVSSVD